MAGGLFINSVETAVRAVYGLEKKRYVFAQVCCRRWRETERLEMTDVLDVVRGVCMVSRSVASGLFISSAAAVIEASYGLEKKR